jgi:hypothetical protein
MAQDKWYFKPWVILIAILLAGPLALPLVWKNPSFSRTVKMILTVLVIAATLWFLMAAADIYKTFLAEMRELEKVLK